MKIRISRMFLHFSENEKTGGMVLVFAALASILIANTRLGPLYTGFWEHHLSFSLPGLVLSHSIAEWVNDGLMTVFFLLVGLEIERELYIGELSGFGNAILPTAAALGGMVVPAVIHFSLNSGTATQGGFAIPMATDIAFSLGVLSLLGRRVPASLKVILTALAIIDDLGAVLIIAFFYVKGLSFLYLGCALAVFAVLIALNRLKIDNIPVYLIGGALLWLFMLKSGVHATISGVFLAFAIPFRKGDLASPSRKVQLFLLKPVPLIVVPVFVLANTAIVFGPGWYEGLLTRNTLGIFAGLLMGKPIGIILASLAVTKAGFASLPRDLTWRHMAGMGLLGGIGFTMSIFITNLAFSHDALIRNSKVAILSASVAASLAALAVLFKRPGPRKNTEPVI